ncbi:MAG TPA: peptidase M17, partial [Anaeromyxobacteraceae bacterium]|nr:peptidase M17 [Anaeromyxobacteraceae bacterium]
MSVRIEMADLGLPAIDALDTEALALFVGPERPLQGLAGFADWRLCGLISRAIRDGRYEPETGEALLLPSGGRIAVPRIFCFGLPRPARDASEFSAEARRLTLAMHKAGSASWAGALPDLAPGAEVPSHRLFLEALL